MLGEQEDGSSKSLADAAEKVTSRQLDKNSRDGNSQDPYTPTEIDQTKKQRGYQRVEDWEADQLKEQKKLSWEERVMYDGQQHGNKLEQNDILRKNLHR